MQRTARGRGKHGGPRRQAAAAAGFARLPDPRIADETETTGGDRASLIGRRATLRIVARVIQSSLASPALFVSSLASISTFAEFTFAATFVVPLFPSSRFA